MKRGSEINAGVLNVQKNVSGIENDVIGFYLEKLLASEEFFRIITIRRNCIDCNSTKLTHILEEWTAVKELDLIIVIGDVNPHSISNAFKNQMSESKFTIDALNYEVQGFDRHSCFVKKGSLILLLPNDYNFYKPFFEKEAAGILTQIHELKSKGKTDSLCSILKGPGFDSLSWRSKVEPVKVAERPRHSTYPMISVQDALDCIIKESCPLTTEQKRFRDCYSYILAEDIIASEPYPPFPASIKDGYAVLANDPSEVCQVIGVVTPGCKLDFDICPGTCVRVSTGSAVPNAANAVIQVEDTTVAEKDAEGNEIKIVILKPAKLNQDIRAVGSDVANGQVLIPKNSKISPAEIGVMAVCGIQTALVFQKPWVALLSTGDEVVEPDAPLMPGCIRDSNKSSLMYMLTENRIPVIDIGIAKDCTDDVKSRLAFAFDSADIIITTGGVSMGERDILKQVLEVDFDAKIQFGRVHMKPGKPTTFSTVWYKNKKKLIFSLPGNPVSAYVCFYLFVIPCIKNLMGYKESNHSTIKVELPCDIRLDERPEFSRVFLKCNDNGAFIAHSTGGQQSSRLLSMQKADALLVLPPKTTQQSSIKAGSKVDAILLKSM